MTSVRPLALAAVSTLALTLAACGGQESLPPSAGFGADPTLPEPSKSLFPTVKVAPAVGWPAGATPTAAQGFLTAAGGERQGQGRNRGEGEWACGHHGRLSFVKAGRGIRGG